MTGFGDAQVEDGDLTVSVEMRSVNNRFLKVQSRLPDGLASLESVIDKLVRKSLARGAVTVSIRLQRQKRESGYQLNTTLLHACWEQLQTAAARMGTQPPADLSSLLVLPDIVQEDNARQANDERAAELIRQAVHQALTRLQVFRADEGRSITADLGELADALTARLEQIITRAPLVVTDYAARLLERVRDALTAAGASVDSSDLIREVSIFADRADINEEITRLKSHLVQFRSFLEQPASEGRKLEFLGQEIYREINTIGAKANDVEIAHHVVEMKATVEKVREILQNVE